MSLNAKTELTVGTYKQTTAPTDDGSFKLWLLRELQSIQRVLTDVTDAAPQATDAAPKNPRNGMVRYAEGAWAAALGAVGMYAYKGGTWTKIV